MRALACCVLVSVVQLCSAQQTITAKFFGLTYHPGGDPSAHLQPNKLDKNARFVMNYGALFGYEKFVYEDLVSIKIIQGLMSDCSAGFASLSHLGIRGRVFSTNKHELYIGIGPTLLIRESWTRFGDEYTSSGYFNESQSDALGDLQWKFVPYGLELEYDYSISEKDRISLSITPALPVAIVTSIGWKHWVDIKQYPEWTLYQPKKH